MAAGRWIVGGLVVALSWVGMARAQEVDLPPDQVTVGEVRITMSSDYARLRVDGEEWENHEFLDNGMTVVINGLDRLEEHVVSLTPIYPDLEPVELQVAPGDWKLVTVAKRVKTWRVEHKVVFQKKAPPKPAPEPAPQDEPAPAPAPAPEPEPAAAPEPEPEPEPGN
jgi:hypothetical protein